MASERNAPKDMTAGAAKLEPFGGEAELREAAKKVGQHRTGRAERNAILGRMRESGIMAAVGINELLDAFERLEVPEKHQVMDLLQQLQRGGTRLGAVAERIGSFLTVADAELRAKVVTLLQSMGADAQEAAMRASGCTRHGEASVRICGLKVLEAIGSRCPPAAQRRVRTMVSDENETPEVREAAAAAVAAFSKSDSMTSSTVGGSTCQSTQTGMGTVALLQAAASAPQDERSGRILATIMGLAPDARARTLLLGLKAGHEPTRALAARLMAERHAEFQPFVPHIQKAYLAEPDLRVREHMADLLCLLFCETFFTQAAQPQA